MVFNTQIKYVQKIVYEGFKIVFDSIAKLLGYPDMPGMPILPPDEKDFNEYNKFITRQLLPEHITVLPPHQHLYEEPQTLTEAVFGSFPYTMPVEKHFYVNQGEGYYNFYIENYRNIFFLPDIVSSYIQMNFNITLDHSNLELCRDVFFYLLLVYGLIVELRSNLFWFIAINPYTLPWSVLTEMVDWIYDSFTGFIPCVGGLDLAPTALMLAIGKITDSVNHLVFTMPFLPSEGQKVKMIIDDEVKDVIQFHYLPFLWQKYSIPINIREFWYFDRPDILDFMEKNYDNINFRPDPGMNEIPLEFNLINLFKDLLDLISISFKELLNVITNS